MNHPRTLRIALIWMSALLCMTPTPVNAQLSPCDQRPTALDFPWVDTLVYCVERVLSDDSAGELGFTALAAAPNGTLYATRPITGEVFAIEDTDGDAVPDTARLIANELTLPNALAYQDGALYIAGGAYVHRWDAETEALTVLIDDLPTGTGFWTGGIAISPDEYLYVGIGAACDACPPDADGRGRIYRFTLDGTTRVAVASGVRQPNGVLWHDGALWFTDTARDALEGGGYDELNRFTPPGQDFGFPGCIGHDNQPDDMFPAADCGQVSVPAVSFSTDSTPTALAVYSGDTFPALDGSLLVVLSGSYNASRLRGYSVVSIALDSIGARLPTQPLIPVLNDPTEQFIGRGLYPHRPYGVAVSPEGWIYLSIGGGQIWVLRPA
ncbi:MAG: PQQ-dependent sugar dehydrogenase [Armatimonadetes bacterium]|nr:PQQ-dependent sugar dehydrogenase [Anaerolineae bacterium]